MSTDHLAALSASADRLAEVRPGGRLALSSELLDVLYDRITEAGEADPAIPAAVAEGDAYRHAIDAGCPPAFHPGVPAEHVPVLEALRERLGLDRADALELPQDADPRHLRILRAIGCEVVGAAD
ncbi:hypothetical protein [Patulibacter sp.]|uniref:hypothetical protein n=1 Tax=Patulibacter sp. TaxID=1912859 RepID=UPI002717162B|nr:hypothetical protein [Patulibacter sp.]MDO9409272.1 hypothetical protein [Patulibacter sp.]